MLFPPVSSYPIYHPLPTTDDEEPFIRGLAFRLTLYLQVYILDVLHSHKQEIVERRPFALHAL